MNQGELTIIPQQEIKPEIATSISSNCNWSEVYDAANLYVQQKRWSEAIAAYYSVIALNPSFFWSYHNLGDVWTQLQQWDEAALMYRRAIQIDPNFFWSYHNLGDVLSQLEQWDEAVLMYRHAIQIDPNFFWSYHNLGNVLSQLQQWDEAIAAYFNAIELDGNAALIYKKLAIALTERGNLAESIQYYRQVIRYPEGDATYERLRDCGELLWQIGNNLAQKHQNQAAIIVYYMVLEIEPDRLEILPQLEKLLQKHNQLQQHIVSRQQQIQSNPGRLCHYQSEIDSYETNIVSKNRGEKFFLSSNRQINPHELESLCEAVGWNRRPLDKVQKALNQSFLVVAIWEISNISPRLIGFARVVSDGVFHGTLLDTVIHPDFQNRGLGKKLISYIVTKLREEGLKELILLASPSVADFYHSLGFVAQVNNLKWMLW